MDVSDPDPPDPDPPDPDPPAPEAGVEVVAAVLATDAADAEATAELELAAAASSWVARSVVNACFAVVRSSSASETALFRLLVSRVAIDCPALTCWPIDTATLATVPAAAKAAANLSFEATVPADLTTWVTDPRSTDASR